MEGSGRFRAVTPTPLRPKPWGASHLGCPGRPRGGGRTKGKESPSRWKVQLSNMAGFRWEGLGGLGVQVGLPTPLIAPQGPLGHLYTVGEGGGAAQLVPKVYAPPSLL